MDPRGRVVGVVTRFGKFTGECGAAFLKRSHGLSNKKTFMRLFRAPTAPVSPAQPNYAAGKESLMRYEPCRPCWRFPDAARLKDS